MSKIGAKIRAALFYGLLIVSFFISNFFFFFMALFLANYLMIKSLKREEYIPFSDIGQIGQNLEWKDLFILALPFIIFVPLGFFYVQGLAILLCVGIVVLLGSLLLYNAPRFYKKFMVGPPIPNYIYRLFIVFGLLLLGSTYLLLTHMTPDFLLFWLIFAIPISVIIILYGIFGPKWFNLKNKH